jgi:hypothetical protein
MMKDERSTRHLFRSILLLLSVFLCLGVRQKAAAQAIISHSVCLDPDDAASRFLGRFRHMMMQRDSLYTRLLNSLNLTRVPADELTIITDPAVCTVAATAYARERKVSIAHVHILKAGDRFLVMDPAMNAGEWKIVLVFDSTFNKSLATFGH